MHGGRAVSANTATWRLNGGVIALSEEIAVLGQPTILLLVAPHRVLPQRIRKIKSKHPPQPRSRPRQRLARHLRDRRLHWSNHLLPGIAEQRNARLAGPVWGGVVP